MGANEIGALVGLKTIRREIVDPAITEHKGRIVKTTGDGLLLEFASAVDAVTWVYRFRRRRRSVPRNGRPEKSPTDWWPCAEAADEPNTGREIFFRVLGRRASWRKRAGKKEILDSEHANSFVFFCRSRPSTQYVCYTYKRANVVPMQYPDHTRRSLLTLGFVLTPAVPWSAA